MPNDERTPLFADRVISKSPAGSVTGENVSTGKDPEAVANESKIPGIRLSVIIPAMAIGIFLAAMDNTIVVSSYGAIGTEMEELNRTSWIATAYGSYLLTTTSFQPLYGKLSDIFGRKAALLLSYVIFGIGCLGCGMARSMNELIAARAFAGIGGGGMTTVASILMSDIVSLRSRGTFQGILNIVFASGAAIGAPLGGLFADSIGWRWAFLVQVPATWIAILVVHFALHLPTTSTETSLRIQFKRVDFLGAVVLVCAVFSLLIGLDRGGNISFNDPIVLGALCISLIAFFAFIYVEGRIAAEPFAPGHIVKERSILSSCMANFFSFAGYMATLFYIPLYYQVVTSLSAGESGLRLVPAIAGGVSGSLFGGITMQKTGKYKTLTVCAYALFMLGSIPVMLYTGLVGTSVSAISAGLLTMGLGNGTGVTTTLIAVIAAAGSDEQAIATAVTYLFRALGVVTGVSVSSALVQGSLRRELSRTLNGTDAEEIVKKVRQSLKCINELPPETREVVVASYENAVHAAFILGLFFGICAVVSSLFIKERSLGR